MASGRRSGAVKTGFGAVSKLEQLTVPEPTRIWHSDPPKLTREHVDEALLWAVDHNASDTVLMTDEPILMRIDGEYRRVTSRRLTAPELHEVLGDIYAPNAPSILAGGDAIDFAYRIQRSRDVELRFRVNATSGQTQYSGHAVGMVLRSIASVPPSLASQNVEDKIVRVHRQVAQSQGLVLCVGATGTGKTTLIAALLHDVLVTPPGRMVLTYESPIEYNLAAIPTRVGAVIQTEIPRHQPSFREGVANALRRAPNVILIGEGRDAATLDGVVTAAQTGHAVYSTVHAHSVAATLPRIIGEFAPAQQRSITARLLDVLRLVVTQRLVPRVGGGRIALREYLEFDPDVRRSLIAADLERLQPEVHAWVERRGQSLLADAERKRADGLITHETYELIAAEWSGRHGA